MTTSTNTGNRNTGDLNTGNRNTGNRNTGDWNTGDWNTGDLNTGNRNTGNRNTGDWNTGDWNTGDGNTGNRNTGNWNTGNRNTGNGNTGDRNTGNGNTGNGNTGDWNTGDLNTGNRNTGDWNTANFCTGAFNTKPQKMVLFNKVLDMTVEEFNAKYSLWVNLKLTEWISEEYMTEKEKTDYETYKTTGGYLRSRTFHEACLLWWSEAQEDEKNKYLTLPGFDSEIFKEVTGIDVNETIEEITMEELCKRLGKQVKIIKS